MSSPASVVRSGVVSIMCLVQGFGLVGFVDAACLAERRARWRETMRSSPRMPRGRNSRMAQRPTPMMTMRNAAARACTRRGRPNPPHQDGAEDRAAIVAGATDDQHGPDLEGEQRHIIVGCNEADEVCLGSPRQSHYGAADGKGLQTEPGGVLAEREGGGFVFPDGAQHASPWAAQQMLECEVEQNYHDHQNAKIEQAECQRIACESGEGARDEADAKGSTRNALQVERDELHRHRDTEGGDGEVVGAQPDRQPTDQEGGKSGGDGRAQPADKDRQAEAAEAVRCIRGCQQRRDISTDGDKTRDADIEQAGLTPLHVEAEAHDRIGQSHGQEEGGVGDQFDAHSALPNRPCGRNNKTATRMTKATAARHSAPITCTPSASAMPTIKPASMAPGTLPIPPRIAAANSGNSRSRPI